MRREYSCSAPFTTSSRGPKNTTASHVRDRSISTTYAFLIAIDSRTFRLAMALNQKWRAHDTPMSPAPSEGSKTLPCQDPAQDVHCNCATSVDTTIRRLLSGALPHTSEKKVCRNNIGTA